MTLAAVLFAVAALAGLGLAAIRLRGREVPPLALALAHGTFAAAGLVALIVAVLRTATADLARVALIVFVAAALGGFVLFSFHLRRRALPVPLVLGHGLVAVAGFVLLLVALLGRG